MVEVFENLEFASLELAAMVPEADSPKFESEYPLAANLPDRALCSACSVQDAGDGVCEGGSCAEIPRGNRVLAGEKIEIRWTACE
jgi:hypothetical protein